MIMEWEFAPDDIVKGRVDYRLQDFRDDLAQEVRMNIGMASEAEFRHAYELIYDLCYWLATGRAFQDFLPLVQDEPSAIRLAKSVGAYMDGNAQMLGAILQRMIMDRVESGLPLEQALDSVAAHHWQVLTEATVQTPASLS
jgi:hypothetical protein